MFSQGKGSLGYIVCIGGNHSAVLREFQGRVGHNLCGGQNFLGAGRLFFRKGGDIGSHTVHMGDLADNLREHSVGFRYVFIDILENLTGCGNLSGIVLNIRDTLCGLLYHIIYLGVDLSDNTGDLGGG